MSKVLGICFSEKSGEEMIKVDTINYEDYEHNKSFLVDYFPKTKRNATIIKDTYKGKIPYVTSDYLDYYEDSVREILKSWGISND